MLFSSGKPALTSPPPFAWSQKMSGELRRKEKKHGHNCGGVDSVLDLPMCLLAFARPFNVFKTPQIFHELILCKISKCV